MTKLPVKRKMLMDEYQKAAIEAPIGITQIGAIAGAGKTSCLTNRIANMVDHGVDPSKICMVTFTRKAAREMLERVTKVLAIPEGQELPVKNGTFHSLAYRLMREYYSRRGFKFSMLDEKSETSLFELEVFVALKNKCQNENPDMPEKEVIKTVKRQMTDTPIKYLIKIMSQAASFTRNPLNLEADYPATISEWNTKNPNKYVEPEMALAFMVAFLRLKRRRNLYNFDDILLYFYEKLVTDKDFLNYVHRNIEHLLVDEFQDVNYLQYLIVKLMTQKSLFAIGDKAQAIYGFRGSNSSFIENFATYFDDLGLGVLELTLKKNYRSQGNILKNAETLIHGNFEDVELIPTLQDGILKHGRFDSRNTEAEYIMSRIKQNYEAGLPYNSQAVLIRGKRSLAALEMAARKFNIPLSVAVGGAKSFFDLKVIREPLAFLKIIQYPDEPYNYIDVLRVFPGVGEKKLKDVYTFLKNNDCNLELLMLATKDKSLAGAIQALVYMLDSIPDLPVVRDEDTEKVQEEKEEQQKRYVFDVLDVFLSGFYEESLAKRFTNKLGVLDNDAYDSAISSLEDFKSIVNNAASLEDFLADVQLNDDIDSDDGDAVLLATMHASKGLEWDVVFLPGWTEGLYPTKSSMTPKEEKQERNLGYVAITRGKKEVYVTYAPVNEGGFSRPSRFFDEAKLYETPNMLKEKKKGDT